MSHIVNGGQAYDTNTWLPPSTPTAKLTEMQLSLWAIRDMVTRIGRDIELLLEERTKPAQADAVQIQAKKLPTEETVSLFVDNEDLTHLGEKLADAEKGIGLRKHRRPRWELLQENIVRLGGEKLFKRKFDAGLARIWSCKFDPGTGYYKRGVYARVDIIDSTLPKNPSGANKKFGMECYTEREFLMLLDTLSTLLNTDLRSRYA